MVFSSIPLYLDPHNWQQQSHQQQQQSHQQQQLQLGGGGGVGGDHGSSSQTNQLPLPSTQPSRVGDGMEGSIRPGSMADRARLAKVPQPEPGLKCPRCESTNTKFCYFNNYSLTQPRHFCKTCRRYWTRGGALRNVPVGGGCRRNKRSTKSGSSSKSPRATHNITSTTSPMSPSNNNTELITHFPQQHSGFPLLPSLQALTTQYASASNLGLSFSGGIQHHIGTSGGCGGASSHSELGFHIGSSSNYPNFLAGFEPPPSALYTFHSNENVEAPPPSSSLFGEAHQIRSVPSSTGDQDHDQTAPVKAEESLSQGFNLLSRPFLGISENNQYWSGNNNNMAWPDLSGIDNPSSTSHNLLS